LAKSSLNQYVIMKKQLVIFIGSLLAIGIAFTACNSKPKSNDAEKPATMVAEKGVHERDEHGEGEGEESGTQFGLEDVYDVVRKGTHMVLSYDAEAKAFKGTVENVSNELLERVRVEVHLSNGTELGPTTQADLQAGEKRELELAVESDDFTSWSTHAEVGNSEHSHESDSEHSHEGGEVHEHN
jgi:hypothetical protein